MHRSLIILTIFLLGCSTPSRLLTTNPIANNNKDVFILSTLVGDHLRQTNGREFSLFELHKNDSLKRISNNFDLIEMKAKGGYISIYFKFSKSRDESEIELSDQEKEMLVRNNWTEKRFDENYDGEIRFDYGERFYRIKRLALKRE